ncbi:MAG: BACON domain-containing carbohydrate-binding protein [Bacteroidales bacterium]|nr:BACON domain-containing carbohydrate-binding protein [Bacteroidales bacterium]MDD3522813.1 BACON domain-containing carbohydrate-binding protein [Bacteroidales bacterium]MDD4030496.1 BACON domain-containing carbohydrate-binding protein [Bacteroidales bacterium]
MRRFSGVIHCLAALVLSVTLLTGCRESAQEVELSVSADKINLPQSGGWVDIIVYTNTSWHVENPQGYHIVPESGTGSASLRLSVEENPSLGTPLTGSFTIKAGELAVSVEITQAGIPPLLEITDPAAEYDYRAGSHTVHITANLPWEARSDKTWCTVLPVSGSGSGSLEISFGENRDPQVRTATITIGNNIHTIFREVRLTQTGFVLDPRMQDSLALVEFFMATEGETWVKNKWDLSAPVDTWVGVRLNAAGRVDSLAMASGVISRKGPVPACLGKLLALELLTLSNNNFTGTLPQTLENLVLLRKLSISSNAGITGNIPAWIGSFTALERLNLSGMTGLTGGLPAELFNLTSLTDLNLVGCTGLGGPIPADIGKLTRLTNLQMSNVPFTGTIPAELGQLRALRSLGLYNTKLELPLPDAFFELENLSSVLFYQNANFNGPLPAGFGKMKTNADRLSIRLENCNFTGTIPLEWAGIPDVTSQLRVQGNRLSGTIPQIVKQHTCWTPSVWNPAVYICPQQPGYGFDNCD